MSAETKLAERIITAIEGHFRDWLMSNEHAEAVELVAQILAEENPKIPPANRKPSATFPPPPVN